MTLISAPPFWEGEIPITHGAWVGPQNTGNVSDYIYDTASPNPNELDVSLQGDGVNDDEDWHHVALTFDEDTLD